MRTMLIIASLALCFGLVSAPQASGQFGVFFGNDDFRVGVGIGGHRHERHVRYDRHDRRFPVARHIHSACCTVHQPGHWEVRERRVWREGYFRTVDIPAEYVTRYDDCGRPYRVCVRPARCERVFVQGCWETVQDRYWVEGYVTYTCGR